LGDGEAARAVGNLKFANDAPATLDDYVTVVSGYMREALKLLVGRAAKREPLPMENWDDVMLAYVDTAPSASAS
jgi:hypothetical protein